MSEHTPGSWSYTSEPECYRVANSNDTPIASVRCDQDARLIAAAPDLLSALYMIDPTGKFTDWEDAHGNPIGAIICDAINKATEQS